MLNWGERGYVLATCDERLVYCRVVGTANMNNTAPFEAFARRAIDRGYREFILDFSGCEAIDSTFLGIVLGLQLGRGAPGAARSRVTAVNVAPSVLRTIAEVGIDRLIEVIPERVDLPPVPLERLERECTESDRLDLILSAHETLCELDDENRRRFGAFVSLLRDELGRRGPAPEPAAAAEAEDP